MGRPPGVLVPRVDRVHCERGLSRGGGNDIAFGEVSARLQLAHGRADDDLVEGIPQPDAIGALWGCGQPEVPRAGVLRGNVAVGVGGAMVRLIPDEQVGRRVRLPRGQRLDAADLHGGIGPRMARHHDARAGDAPRGVKHDLPAVDDEHHPPPLGNGPLDQGRRGCGLPESRRRDQQHAAVVAVSRSHAGDGLLLIRS